MKHLKSLLLILLALVTSLACFSCGKQNEPVTDPTDSTEQTPSDSEELPPETASLPTAEEAYVLLKGLWDDHTDRICSAKSFTAWDRTTDTFLLELDADNTDLGATNLDGDAWASEAEKEQVLAQFREALSEYSETYLSWYQKISYDGENKIGYDDLHGDYLTTRQTLLQPTNEGSLVYQREGNDREKYTAGSDYDMNFRQDAARWIFNALDYLLEKDTLAEAMAYIKTQDWALTEDAADPTVSLQCENGVYTLQLIYAGTVPDEDLEYLEREGLGVYTGGTYTQTFTIIFTESGLQFMRSSYEEHANGTKKINDSEQAGAFASTYLYQESCELGFTETYDADAFPDFGDLDDYEDQGSLGISVMYFIGGYYLCDEEHQYGSAVQPCNYSGLKSGLQWYVDEDCTVPFDATVYPSYDLCLYIDGFDVCEKDCTLMASYGFAHESDYLAWRNSGKEPMYSGVSVVPIKFKPDSGNGYIFYVNGVRYERGSSEEITFREGELNEYFFIWSTD